MEYVDVLVPPTFHKSWISKPLVQAWEDRDRIGTFNLWIIQNTPDPAIVYQVRSLKSSWAPGKFDVTAWGHYSTGEELYDGLREVREELGRNYSENDVTYIWKKIHVSPDTKWRMRQNVVDISFIVDNSPVSEYVLEETEVYAVAILPIEELIKVHTQDSYQFESIILTCEGRTEKVIVNKESFPYNRDDYHFKVVLLAERFLKWEKYIIY